MLAVLKILGIPGSRELAKTVALLVGATMVSTPGVVFADSIFPLQASHEMATSSLGRVLAERGWKVSHEDDGGILLYPHQGNTDLSNTEVVKVAETVADTRQKTLTPMMDTAYWQASLEPHGWGVEADPDGSVVLTPGAVKVSIAVETRSISPQAEFTDQMDLTVLRDRLSVHGWGVERDLDGSVLLKPGAVEVQAVAAAPSISPPQVGIPGQMDLAWLREHLSPHGWGVERDLDGSVLLTPGAEALQAVAITRSRLSLAGAGST